MKLDLTQLRLLHTFLDNSNENDYLNEDVFIEMQAIKSLIEKQIKESEHFEKAKKIMSETFKDLKL